ncbi:MAG: hypothetical protein ACI39G_04950 [Pseudoramibacter sp.]
MHRIVICILQRRFLDALQKRDRVDVKVIFPKSLKTKYINALEAIINAY